MQPFKTFGDYQKICRIKWYNISSDETTILSKIEDDLIYFFANKLIKNEENPKTYTIEEARGNFGFLIMYDKNFWKSIKIFKKLKINKSARMIVAWLKKSWGDNNPRDKGKGLSHDKKGIWRYHIGNYRILGANVVWC